MKKYKMLGLLAAASFILTGCIDSMPELTDEQTEMISEYSARLLLKYSSNYNYRLADDRVLAEAILQEELLEDAQEEASEQPDIPEQTDENESGTQEQASEPQAEEQEPTGVEVLVTDEADIAELLGIDGAAIKYQSFEVCSSYPKESSGFSVTAAQGKKLLVVHFDIESATGEDAECNLLDQNLSIRMNVNGRSLKVMNTLLPNDISSYIDTIHAGDVQEVVALAEMADMEDADIETLTMRISANSGSFDIQLR